MASSWDCASALSPQSGKVAAKSNHLVTLRRCEEARRPLEDSAAEKTRLRIHGLALDLHKSALTKTRPIVWADVFGASSSATSGADEQQRRRLNQPTTAAVPSARRPGRKCSSRRETSGMTAKMATDSRITRLSALTSLQRMNYGASVSQCQNVHF